MTSRNWFLVVGFILVIALLFYFAFFTYFKVEVGQIDTFVQVEKNEQIIPEPAAVAVALATPKIFFVGDLMLARNVERRLATIGVKQALSGISPLWSDSYVVANFEAAIPEKHVPAPDFTFQFSVNSELLPGLEASGVTHVSLANNHSYDFGVSGYQNTMTSLNNIGIEPFGHPYNLSSSSVSTISTGNRKVAIIGINLISSKINIVSLKEVVEKLSMTTDLQIVYIHWGDEYIQKQSLAQRELAISLAEMGIDVIIGHHPHVIQGIEQINKTLVFYSLGNFIFDQYFSEEVQLGLMLSLDLKADGAHFELIPVSSLENRVRPVIAEELVKLKVLNNIAKYSDEALNNEIVQGKLILPWKLATSAEVVIMTE